MKLIDDLMEAAKNNAIDTRLSLLLGEAATCIMRLETQDLYDQLRMNWLEDLGSFSVDKKDGCDPVISVEMQPGQYFCAQAPTVREAVDLAFEECSGISPAAAFEPDVSERGKFEKWMRELGNGDLLHRTDDGGYADISMDYAWHGWQACARKLEESGV